MLKMSNLNNRKGKYFLIPLTFILVLSSVLFSSCGLFATSGTIIFTSNRVQIAGSQQYPSLQPLDTEIYSVDQTGITSSSLQIPLDYPRMPLFLPTERK